MHVVTRVELVEAVRTAFDHTATPTLPKDLVIAAQSAGAHPALVLELEQLQDDLQFRKVRDLWEHFPHMPVDGSSPTR